MFSDFGTLYEFGFIWTASQVIIFFWKLQKFITKDPSEQKHGFDPGVAGSQIAETHFKVEAREGHKSGQISSRPKTRPISPKWW